MRESISLKGSTLLHGAYFVAQNRDRSSMPLRGLPRAYLGAAMARKQASIRCSITQPFTTFVYFQVNIDPANSPPIAKVMMSLAFDG